MAARIAIGGPVLGQAEAAASRRVILSGRLSQGKEVDALEQEFAATIGARHAVAVSSGTAALELALRALGVGPGDEVVTTPFSFFATAASILNVGATPVFADVELGSGNIDPESAASVVTPRTAAIMPVHLYGRPCDMVALSRVARRYGLAVVEDACQAVGARYASRSVGTFGVGCFSFYGSKNITCGEGGMIAVANGTVAAKVRELRSHGSRVAYVHRRVSANYRMTDLQAAILRVQLTRLGAITRRRQQLASLYDRLIHRPGVILMAPNDAVYQSCYHQYTIRVRSGRQQLRRALASAEVEARVYYPRPIHRQPVWSGHRDPLPRAERLASEVLSVPVHPLISADDARYVAAIINRPRW